MTLGELRQIADGLLTGQKGVGKVETERERERERGGGCSIFHCQTFRENSVCKVYVADPLATV